MLHGHGEMHRLFTRLIWDVSSIEPDGSGSEMKGAEEVAGGLAVAGGNAAILRELVEELPNQMTRPV